jgi:hypothetical protein
VIFASSEIVDALEQYDPVPEWDDPDWYDRITLEEVDQLDEAIRNLKREDQLAAAPRASHRAFLSALRMPLCKATSDATASREPSWDHARRIQVNLTPFYDALFFAQLIARLTPQRVRLCVVA